MYTEYVCSHWADRQKELLAEQRTAAPFKENVTHARTQDSLHPPFPGRN